MKRLGLLTALVLVPSSALAGGEEPFEFHDPGDLINGSGEGLNDDTVYAPGMRFPMEDGPAYANSQVYMHGGYLGPGGGQCDDNNYSYPWRDNYCETRSWDMPLCPAGEGHQGQDIRPGTCDAGVHWNVASADGQVTNIGSYSVYVTGDDGTRYDYLHGEGNIVGSGQALSRGDRINLVSNEFGGTATTIHTHFNLRQDVAGLGFIYVSPYMSLVTSYQELFGLTGDPAGALEATDCAAITGWAWDESDPDAPVSVRIAFDGPQDGRGAAVIEVVADRHREDLCDTLGSCEHGFEVEVPVSLRDQSAHPVHAYMVDGDVEIDASPLQLQCDPPAVPSGVKRLVSGPEAMAAWSISPLWDVAWVDPTDFVDIDSGPDLPDAPLTVVSDADASTVWLIDAGYRRRVPDADVADAWGLDYETPEVWPDDDLEQTPMGTPLDDTRFLLSGPDGSVWAIDDEQCPLDDNGQPDPDCEPSTGDDDDDDDGDDDDDDGDGGGNEGGGPGDGGEDGDGAGEGETDGPGGRALPAAYGEGTEGCACRASGRGDRPGLPLGFAVLTLLAVLRRPRCRT